MSERATPRATWPWISIYDDIEPPLYQSSDPDDPFSFDLSLVVRVVDISLGSSGAPAFPVLFSRSPGTRVTREKQKIDKLAVDQEVISQPSIEIPNIIFWP